MSANNPPAFPVVFTPVDFHEGMTLRDYFAAKAMNAQIATEDVRSQDKLMRLAHWSYQMADAMLEVREQK
jgi:hypothetical protein